MTDKEIEYIVWLLKKYYRIANSPDDLNNIIIEGHTISIIQNGVEGYKVVSKKNGNSIFLPAAGYYQGTYFSSGSCGHWSSTRNIENYQSSQAVYCVSGSGDRSYGYPISPVCP